MKSNNFLRHECKLPCEQFLLQSLLCMMAMKARWHNQTSLHKAKVPSHDPLHQVCSIKKFWGGKF